MKKRQRLHFILFILASLSAAVGLSLYALQDNISFFYSPMEVKKMNIAPEHRFRLGGLVKKGTLQKHKDTLSVSFTVTDEVQEMRIEYTGILPDLFREGQGVVATGSLNAQGVFIATDILAKHDEKYMPPEVAKSLEKAAREKKR
ncbi:MAG: cytochrome c maturation protein CcmE [Alphaproteobacteria bacterium]|nr:cytochrome c maturation protein CcmE [Alphaproteobacteria bacterium]